jgi:leader peptidase (prepilin peptidase)/N-methyltransferase
MLFSGPPWLLAAALFVVGTIVGRFLNRCIDRFPRDERLREQLTAVLRTSASERTLRVARRPWHYVPVVGWLVSGNPLSRGRSSDLRHAAVELGNGLLFAAILFAEFPNGFLPAPPMNAFAIEGISLPTPADHSLALQVMRLVLHLLLVESLLVATVIDFQKMIIPDGATVPAMLLGVVASAAAGGVWLVPLWYEDAGLLATLGMGDRFGGGIEIPPFLMAHPHIHGLLVSLAGLIVGGGTVCAVRWIGHWALGREAMGFGDVVLMATIGAYLGWQPVLTIFFLAPVCAIVVVCFAAIGGASREFPFGPWLSLAAILLLVAWQPIWSFAGQFFQLGRFIVFVALSILVLLAILLRGMRLIRGDRYWMDITNEHWTSADQLLYLSQENNSDARSTWHSRSGNEWSGLASGRGQLGERRWRNGPPPTTRWPGRRRA